MAKQVFAIGETVVVEIGTAKLIGRVNGVCHNTLHDVQYRVRHLRGEESYEEFYRPHELRTASDDEKGIRQPVGFVMEVERD